ncbi:hypothetical protein [Streptomyces sp. NBC_00103]|uniref:hypothetical protein n=1 Tax=Streptomyces sp. NBC_00103 TaxID=2975653 RepID=UPI00224D04FE|nr:hypothetical protein [Streptomyces sp. NBC_00103]MCX5370203.1 hypothetical protein [Streptomyces sp. NBC_00103]
MGRGLAVAAARLRRAGRALGAAPAAPTLLAAARGAALRLAAPGFVMDRPVVIVASALTGSAAAVVPAVASAAAIRVAVVIRVATTVRVAGGPVYRRVLRVRLGSGRAGRIRA